MEQTLPLNPWLTEAIKRFRARHTDADLRESYRNACECESPPSWQDFIMDSAFEEALQENPFLEQEITDTDFPDHLKDILRINYIDTVGHFMQLSLEELEILKGLSKEEIQEVVDFLEEGGFRLEEKGRTLKQVSRWQEIERMPSKLILEEAQKKAQAIVDNASLWDYEAARRASDIYDRAFQSLQFDGADKGLFLKLLESHAVMLRPYVDPESPLNAKAINVATKLARLTEYLYGQNRGTVETWELLEYNLERAEEYALAYEYAKKILSLRLTDSTATPQMLATRYNNVGTNLMELGRNEEALDPLLKALAIGEKALEPDRQSLYFICHNIAEAYSRLGDKDKMFEYIEKADLFNDNPIPH